MLIKQQNKIQFSISNFQFPKKTGFSLIELLVVISIIGVLSAVLVANFMGMRERARDAQKIQDLYAVKNALRMYYNDHQSYPSSDGLNASKTILSGQLDDYISAIDEIDYWYSQNFGGGEPDNDRFKLYVELEAGAGDEDDDSARKCGEEPNDYAPQSRFYVCGN